MNRTFAVRALLAGTALVASTAAMAQDTPAPAPEAEAQLDTSDATADAEIAAAQPVDDLNAKIELLQAQVEALQAALEGVKTAQATNAPSWKGAPLFEDKEAGWSMKIRGRLQYDVGFIGNPDDNIITRNLGFNHRARRIRLGAEGTIPGGFGYKAEMDFAGGSVGFGDVVLTYAPKNRPWSLQIGNQETLNGLEQMTSSRWSSFVERAAFDDAFINTRRLGLVGTYTNKAGDFRASLGAFAAHSIDGTFDNDGWIGAARAVYSPLMGNNQLHFGLNYQHREFQSNNGSTVATSSGQPSTNQLARYRARPLSQLTDVRFVDTGNFAAKSDDILGLEVAGIFKSFHFAAEGQYLKANAYDAGSTISGGDPLDLFPSASQFVPDGNPSFWGGYAEVGYFFTGETRGYKAGLWDRTKVLKPFSKGGWGAIQGIARVDYLDLDSGKLKGGCTNNFTTGACTGVPQLAKGGTQLGLQLGLTWIPEDYVRFLLNYAHVRVNGGPQAGVVDPTSTDPLDERNYSTNLVQARAQIDF